MGTGAGKSPSPDTGTVALRNVDVTIVYPLPNAGHAADLLAPKDDAGTGPFLAPTMFADGVPELDAVSPLPASERWSSLRVVAVRFDPCFGVLYPPAPGVTCEPDIRVVYQSIVDDGERLVARDGAIHVFYCLSTAEFADALTELRAARAERSNEPEGALGVNPSLVSEGPRGPYARRIEGLLERYATEKNAVRVTHFVRTASKGDVMATWSFAIRERTDTGFADVVIPSTRVDRQTLTTIVGGRWDADITPAVPLHDDVTRLFKVGSRAEEKEAFRATVRALSPRLHTSESIDCATCHITQSVAVFAGATRGLDVGAHEERFQSRYPVDSVMMSDDDAIGFKNVHMLSYLGRVLNVSPRVANETAAVLEVLDGAP